MKKTLLIVLSMIFSASLFAQSNIFLGNWKSFDEKTGAPKALINVYRNSDGTYFGKIVKLLQEDAPENPRCTACTGVERNRPIVGMIILKSMRYINKELIGGTILDPETGKVYYVTITFEKDGRLKLRGSLDKKGIVGKNQYWEREE